MSNPNAKARRQITLLKKLNIYGVLLVQIIASAILIAITLWLFLRFPEPQVHVRGFDVDGINKTDPNHTLLHYNFTLHNPDLYKSVSYDVLVLRITYSKSGYTSGYGATIDFNGKGIHQRPGETTLLPNHTANYTAYSVGWKAADMVELRTSKEYIILKMVMEVKFLIFNSVIGSRQMMKTADIYFDDAGKAFIDGQRGLMLE